MSSSSEVQLTEATSVVTSHDDSGSAGESEPVLASSDTQAEDVQPVTEVVDNTAASEETPTADDGDVENLAACTAIDDEKRSTPEKADSDVSAECSRMVTTKARGARSYQESRRCKKPVGEKSKSVSSTSKCKRTRELVDTHGPDPGCLEQKGKGDVEDAGMQQEYSLRHVKDSLSHPTGDGDQPALVNVIIDEHDMQKRYAAAADM